MAQQTQLVIEILRSRQKQFPDLFTDESNISQTLISLFTALDQRYFELSNEHIILKEQLQRKESRLQSIQPQLSVLSESKHLTQSQNIILKKQISTLNSKISVYQQTIHINELKLDDSNVKITDQQKLLLHQSEQISQLAHKCMQLQQTKYSLSEKLKQSILQKQIIGKDLNFKIQQIQNIRQSQKVQIDNVTSSIHSHQQLIQSLKSQNQEFKQQLALMEVEIQKITCELQSSKKQINELEAINVTLKKNCLELQQNSSELVSKKQQFENIKDQYNSLKQRQGHYDIMLQNLSAEKQRLNRQINRMNTQAKNLRKYSDNESINTQTAFEYMTQSFKFNQRSHLNIVEQPRQDLNKSYQDIGSKKQLSMSAGSKLLMPSGGIDLALNHNQQKILQLQNQKRQLQNIVLQLKQQLEQFNCKQSNLTLDKNFILQQQVLSEKQQQNNKQQKQNKSIIKPRVIQNYSLTIAPQIKLFSLYSVAHVKIKPRNKIQSSSQTDVDIIQEAIEHYKSIKLSFDPLEIQQEITTSRTINQQHEESFFDKLSKMFCGGSNF